MIDPLNTEVICIARWKCLTDTFANLLDPNSVETMSFFICWMNLSGSLVMASNSKCFKVNLAYVGG